MEFNILGPLDVRRDDRSVSLGRPQQRAVLGALLLQADQVVSLDGLADCLWAGRAPPRAVGTLQAYVSNLRRALEPDRPARARPEVLVSGGGGYLLRTRPGQLDAERFEALAAAGRRHLAAGRPEAASQALTAALGLWRGQPLGGLGLECWHPPELARLDELRWSVREARIDAELACGRHAGVVAELRAMVAQQPLREGLWGQLMLALYRSGRQVEALRAYQDVRLVLADQLGLCPAPALARLEEDILRHASELEWRPPPGSAAPLSSPAPVLARPGAGPAGRQAEWGALACALDDALGGRRSIVLLSGEAGSGKTTLAIELARRAEGLEATVVWGRAWDGPGAPALWPWSQVLSALGRDGGDLDGPGAGAEAECFRRCAAVATAVGRAAEAAPLVVVLEDLHWADGPTLEVLRMLARSPGPSRLLVLACYRPGEAALVPSMQRGLAALAGEESLQALALGPLGEAAVAELIDHTIGGGSAAVDLVPAVHVRSDGNAFYAVELARLARPGSGQGPGSGHGGEAAAAVSQVPARVRESVLRQLCRLPVAVVAFLELAAVAGRDFDLLAVEVTSGLVGDRPLELVEVALAVGFLVERPGAAGRFRFAHALVRDVLCERLSAVRRERMGIRLALARTRVDLTSTHVG